MNEDKIQRTIEFIIQSQADSAVRQAIFDESLRKLKTRQDKLYATVKALAKVTQDMVTVAQLHSQRLDRIEGIQ